MNDDKTKYLKNESFINYIFTCYGLLLVGYLIAFVHSDCIGSKGYNYAIKNCKAFDFSESCIDNQLASKIIFYNAYGISFFLFALIAFGVPFFISYLLPRNHKYKELIVQLAHASPIIFFIWLLFLLDDMKIMIYSLLRYIGIFNYIIFFILLGAMFLLLFYYQSKLRRTITNK